jgi:hypothetical protein
LPPLITPDLFPKAENWPSSFCRTFTASEMTEESGKDFIGFEGWQGYKTLSPMTKIEALRIGLWPNP